MFISYIIISSNVYGDYTLLTFVPFLKNVSINFFYPIIYALFIILVVSATSNAVNLTDGLDGLAAGLLAISVSRLIPHPPNFTSLIAISFYIPAIFGYRYIAPVIFAFGITDLILGFHSVILFTWGSIILIGIISKYFSSTLTSRFLGVLTGAVIFFVTTNFGVWLIGSYGYTISGLLTCYVLAIQDRS